MESEFDIQSIMEMLPHRYPFLLVDRVITLIPDDRIVALKNVTINEPFFQGHFPGKPVMPGKMVSPGDQIIFEAKILKFRSKVAKMSGTATVGDQLVAEAELMASFGDLK